MVLKLDAISHCNELKPQIVDTSIIVSVTANQPDTTLEFAIKPYIVVHCLSGFRRATAA